MNLENNIKEYRNIAIDIFKAGIAAADPEVAVNGKLSELFTSNPDIFNETAVVAVGKAGVKMMRGALPVLSNKNMIIMPIIVTNIENFIPFSDVDIMSAGHPLPDKNGLDAARKIANLARSLTQGQTLLMLISGGASAMLPLPSDGISLEDKINITDKLLASGCNINDINIIRKSLSQLKGGGLAKMASPANVISLILSDVIGDDLGSIASGITVLENNNYGHAINILKKKQIWNKMPNSVKKILIKKTEKTKVKNNGKLNSIDNYLIGSNSKYIHAMAEMAISKNYNVEILYDPICGEAKIAAKNLVIIAKNKLKNKLDHTPLIIVAGGETTVTLNGNSNGKGGRNQEFALAFAINAKLYDLPNRWILLSGGTDGRDGPTNAAGAVVDPFSIERIDNAGFVANESLNNNDSYNSLMVAGDLIITGSTGTNVADLQLLILF